MHWEIEVVAEVTHWQCVQQHAGDAAAGGLLLAQPKAQLLDWVMMVTPSPPTLEARPTVACCSPCGQQRPCTAARGTFAGELLLTKLHLCCLHGR